MPAPAIVFLPTLWQLGGDCDVTSQPSTECGGGSASSRHADSETEDAQVEGQVGTHLVVRNTFIELKAPTDDGSARRRAHSTPCGRATAERE